MSSPLAKVWVAMFPAASKRTQEVDKEIDLLRQIEERREQTLAKVSDSLISRVKELNKMVEEMKDSRGNK